MNVFILDKNMEKSAQMLDDARLRVQINEATQILMANYNREHFPDAKIGHVNHPVTKFYEYGSDQFGELFEYLSKLLVEYNIRFNKYHQNDFWFAGFLHAVMPKTRYDNEFKYSKTYINGVMTDDISEIRKYISTKPMHKKPTWTNREKPDWWEV